MQEVKQLAAQKHYGFSNPLHIDPNNSSWVSYILIKDGPAVSFCADTLSGIDQTWTSNLHEFTNLLKESTRNLGAPEIESKQEFAQGVPYSSVIFKWEGTDNVNREIALHQYASDALRISYGLGYRQSPCRH